MPPRNALAAAESALRRHALTYPDAYEEFPWGERALKVKGKIFVMMYRKDGVFGLSLKLPVSGRVALGLPFASPTAYGLGKSGWVSARFAPADKVPIDMIKEWIDESYRAIAPKKLVAQLEPEGAGAGERRTAAARAKKKRTRR